VERVPARARASPSSSVSNPVYTDTGISVFGTPNNDTVLAGLKMFGSEKHKYQVLTDLMIFF
jgi:hypothetical protein